MKKHVGKLVKYLALANLLLGSMPLAYAETIQTTIDQEKSTKYYDDSVEKAKESAVPTVNSQEVPPPTSQKEVDSSVSEKSSHEATTETKDTALSENEADTTNKAQDIRLPEVTEQKENEEEKALRTKYGEPVSESGQEQIYRVDDTHFITYLSGEEKTFKDENGEEQPLDLGLVTETSEGQANYKPSSSPVEVVLPSKVDQKAGIQISKGENTLEIHPKDTTYENATVKENALLYNNTDESDDVQYTVTDTGVKEDIILNSWREKHQFTYQFSSKDYSASLDNNQVIVTQKGKDTVLFILSAPEMIDQKGEKSEAITLNLQEVSDHFELTIDADKEWLKDEKRAYPVKIDPTVTVPSSNMIDSVTSSVHGTYQGRGYGYVGYITQAMTGIWDAKDVGRTRIYSKINYDFSKIPKEARIDNATYNLYQYIQYPQTNATFTSYKLTQDFNINTLNWDNSVGLTQEPTGEKAVSKAKHGMHHFDIRDAVNSWVQGTSKNYGLVVQATNENDYGGAFYTTYSTGSAGQEDFTPDKRPSLTINWSIPDPVDINYPIKNTSIALRSLMNSDKRGKLQVQGVFADGLTTPGAIVDYALSDPKKEYAGQSFASYSYKYPNSSLFDAQFPKGTTKYRDKLSNWQTGIPFTQPDFNKVYTIAAESKKESQTSGKKTSDKFVIYKVTQYDTLPKIAAYYGVPLAQIIFDNRVQDMLLLSNNTLFIRNPKKNANKPYNPPKLSNNTKQDIDSLLMGRGLHCEFGFEPINLNTGNFYLDRTDVSIPSYTSNFEMTRAYNSKGADINSLFGRGWANDFNEQVTSDDKGNLYYSQKDGRIVKFEKDENTYHCPKGYDLSLSVKQIKTKETDFGNGKEKYNVNDYIITDSANQQKTFNYFGLLTSQKDEKGNVTKLSYNKNSQLTTITDPSGAIYNITMNDAGFIGSITVPNGSKLLYNYDDDGHLIQYTDATGANTRYEYNKEGLMSAWYDGNGTKIIENTYDNAGRVIKQVDGNGDTSTLSYAEHETKAIDGNGHTTIYQYDNQYRTKKILHPDGTKESKAYSNDNRLTEETNPADQTTQYTYDTKGNKITETRFDGKTKHSTYDIRNHLTSEKDFAGKKTSYSYDAKGNLTVIQAPNGSKTGFSVDEHGRIKTTIDPNGNKTSYDYSGAFLTKITNPLKGVTTIAYNAHGLPIKMTNPLGGETQLSYDSEGRKLSETDPDGHKETTTYDASGQVISQTDGNGATSQFTYDALGNKKTMVNSDGGVYSYTYDGTGNQIKMTDPDGHETAYTFDERNQLTSETNPAKQTLSYQRDALGRVISKTNEANQTTTYTYNDSVNQLATTTDALKQVTENRYDTSGNLIEIQKPDGTKTNDEFDDLGQLIKHTDEQGVVTTYVYDAAGNKLSETVDGQTTTFTYDALDNVTKVTDPMNKENTYTYDALGNVLTFTDARGKTTSYSYTKAGALAQVTDALGNQSKISYDGNGNQSGVTDAAGYTATTTYNGLNLPATITDGLGNKTTYEYSQIEQLTSATDALGNKKTYEYNELGYPTIITDENGNAYKLSYTPTAQTEKIENPDGSTITNSYDALDRLVKETHSNGLITEYTYDANDRVIQMKDNQGKNEQYTYNAHGDRLSEENSLGEKTTFDYDQQGNMTKVTHADKTVEAFTYDAIGNLVTSIGVDGKKTTYSYDENGNLKESSDIKGRKTLYDYDAINQLVTETNPAGETTTYNYDVLGNVAKITDANGEKTSYSYDANQNLVLYTDAKKNTTALKYDPLNRLSEKVSPTGNVQQFSYDALGNKLSEKSGEGNVTQYTYDPMNQLSSVTKPTGGVTNYTYDQMGSLHSETDANGHKTTYETDLYGQTTKRTLPNGATYTYAYDKLGRLAKQSAPKGLSQTYSYDISGNMIQEEDQSKRKTTYDYDKEGHLLKTTNPANLTTQFEYDDAGNMTQATTPSGKKTNYSYDVLDQVKTVTQPTGRKTSYDYDPVGQLTIRTINGKRKETYHYDPNGNLTETINALGQKSINQYDAEDRLVSETNTAGQMTTYDYDKDDRVKKVTSSEGTFNEFSYDENDNLTQVSSGGKQLERYEYDKADQLTKATTGIGEKAATTSYAYDTVGNITEITNGNGKVTKYKYDELSNVIEKVNSLGDTTSYTYDVDNRLNSVKQPNGKAIQYDYNKLDQLLQVNYSEKADGSILYTYDADGNRVSMDDLTGQTNYEYNDEDEITGVRQGDGSLITYDYDEFGNIKNLKYADGSRVHYEYDDLDRLTKVTDKKGKVTTYTYDDAGNMTKIKRADGTTSTLSYRLDNRVEGITHKNKKGHTLSSYHYDYDADNNVSEEVITQDGQTIVQRYEYDTLGQLSQMTVLDKHKKHELANYVYAYDPAGNKLSSIETINGHKQTTSFTYDDANRLITLKDGKKTIHYTYDKNGNRIKQSGTDNTQEYIYDTENRLLAVKDNKGLLMAALYDGDDNRVFTASRTEGQTSYQLFKRQEKKESKKSKAVISKKNNRRSPQTSPTGEENSLFWYGFTENVVQGLSGLPETVGHLWMSVFDTISRTYHQKIAKDRANKEGIVVNPPSLGNRPGEGKVTYSSEVKDVLIPYTSREDTYQYYDVRNYVNDVNQEETQVLQTYDDQSKPHESYTYGNDRIDYTNEQTDETYQYLTDGKGSVTGLVNNEEVIDTMSYGAYGEPKVDEDNATTDTGNPYGYTGEAQDVTGFNYLRARYYDSTSGTFLTEDSYEGELETPVSQNAYTYVENNPINFTDPTGHKKNIFQRAWAGAKKYAKKAVNAVVKYANKAKNWVVKQYNNAKRWVGNVVNTVVRGAQNVWNGATSYVRSAYTTVSNYFSSGSYGSSGQRQIVYGPANYGNARYGTTYMQAANGSGGSFYYISQAQLIAIQTAQRQRRITADYSKATGNKGTPKTKEGKNLFKNWNKSLKKTLTHFCSTAKRVAKNTVKTGVAFTAGFMVQVLENNMIKPITDSLFGELRVKDWIKQNKGYNVGVFVGNLSGLVQAAFEYQAAVAIAVGGTGGGLVAAPVTGGASTAAIPTSYAAAATVATHATGVLGTSIQSLKNGSNYNTSSNQNSAKNWNKGSHDSSNASLQKHFEKHGKEVGAENVEKYARKAEEFAKTAKKGSKKSAVRGEVDGVIRYKKNGKYIDLAPDGTIISFGKQ